MLLPDRAAMYAKLRLIIPNTPVSHFLGVEARRSRKRRSRILPDVAVEAMPVLAIGEAIEEEKSLVSE